MDIRRTPEAAAQYEQEQRRHTNFRETHSYDQTRDIVVNDFTHWYIIKNNFPYDFVAEDHDMLVPKRVFGTIEEATPAEREEYESIIRQLESEKYYDSQMLNFSKDRSVLRHLHIHLIVWKKN